MNLENTKIAIIGLGYVGLPLAIEFGKKYKTVGFDINTTRIEELRNGYDRTQEATNEQLNSVQLLEFSSEINHLKECNVFIVTVPTPIDQYKKPDIGPLISASKAVGSILKKGDVVIYESTVYPGCTEEDCVPVLEKTSGLTFNKDFFCGYSPERINPGDKKNTLTTILKITSGSSPEAANFVDNLYKSIITAGTHKAESLKVAEAAKLIENCQRDVNISFVNELALIFDKMNINTSQVLAAAGTKWNFLKFQPGLVGGHCIGVDPYYMIQKAESLGYYPNVIGAGRKVNDSMGHFVADKVIKLMIDKELNIKKSRALILGITFKENCPDIRNTRVVDIYEELNKFGLQVDVYDPWANAEEVKQEYGINMLSALEIDYDTLIVAVSHDLFSEKKYLDLAQKSKVIFDIKGILPASYGATKL
jgi:UDP-N-acetyl-D-glucosamine/UDP-N-acetyl-D-galactosamine dehydrogenase